MKEDKDIRGLIGQAREFSESIKTEYEKSLSSLLSLEEKLRKTDWLIDQIVYKLYGLTEDQIRIVKGRIKE